jgi:hypothetical protein
LCPGDPGHEGIILNNKDQISKLNSSKFQEKTGPLYLETLRTLIYSKSPRKKLASSFLGRTGVNTQKSFKLEMAVTSILHC